MYYDNDSKIIAFLGSGASTCVNYRTFNTFDDLIFQEQVKKKEYLEVRQETINILTKLKSTIIHKFQLATHDNYLWALQDIKQYCDIFKRYDLLSSIFQQDRSLFVQLENEIDVVINDLTNITIKLLRE